VDYAVKLDHRMAVERGREPIPVRVDRRRIESALANLLENACKYSPEGGGIVVRCRASDAPAWAEVSVEDHGVGIAATDLPHLFTRFGRIVTTENSHIPGTGLGLYLSRQLALLHGGDITVESTPGEGSRFTLRLPLVPPGGEIPAAEVFLRQAEEMAKQQGGLDTAPSAMLPGENPSTPYAQDARHWATVYQELVKIKEDILEQLRARGHRTHAAQSQVDREGESLKIEIERLRAHLLYWQERAKSLEY
jgi:anti-sigma regulatory factor (Ser/Thr protein kinase)